VLTGGVPKITHQYRGQFSLVAGGIGIDETVHAGGVETAVNQGFTNLAYIGIVPATAEIHLGIRTDPGHGAGRTGTKQNKKGRSGDRKKSACLHKNSLYTKIKYG
jgi:hypothetical protein